MNLQLPAGVGSVVAILVLVIAVVLMVVTRELMPMALIAGLAIARLVP